MRLQEIGFREDPFAPGLDPRFVFLNDSRRHVLAALISEIREGERLLLVTGSRGIGKTTTLRSLANVIEGRADLVLAGGGHLLSCHATSTIAEIDAAFRAAPEGASGRTGAVRVLLLDDVDSLPLEVLAAVKQRAFGRAEADGAAVVVMTATDRGRRPDRAEDRTRREGIDFSIKLEPFAAEDVPPFIHHRLRAAGYDGPELFAVDALERVAFYGNGSPQRITKLCAEVLVAARRLRVLPISPELVKDVAWELFVPERLRRMAKSFAGGGSESSFPHLDEEEEANGEGLAGVGGTAAMSERRGRLSDLVSELSGSSCANPLAAAVANADNLSGRIGVGAGGEPAADRLPASTTQTSPADWRRWGKSFALGLLLAASLLVGGGTGFYLVQSQGLSWRGVAEAGERVVSSVSSWMSGVWNAVGERFSGSAEQPPAATPRGNPSGQPEKSEAPEGPRGHGDRATVIPARATRGTEPAGIAGGAGGNGEAGPLAAAVPVAKPPRQVAGEAAQASTAPAAAQRPHPGGDTRAADPPPPPAEGERPVAGADADQLLARGNRLLELGDLASARLFFRVVAERGDATATMLMGLTYDPVHFRQQGIRGARPEADEAMAWYRRAIALGSKEAEQRVRVLISWLHWRAETGDGEAARVLQLLR